MDIEWRAVSSMPYYCGLKVEFYNIVTAYNDSLCDLFYFFYPSDLMKWNINNLLWHNIVHCAPCCCFGSMTKMYFHENVHSLH